LVAAVVLAGTAAGGVTKPTLKLVRVNPLTVHGSGFMRRERVRVTVVANRTFARSVRTTAAGTFTAAFGDVSLSFDRCGDGWLIAARGARGDAAVLKLPQPECPPSLGP
jgi:hypothetical protein